MRLAFKPPQELIISGLIIKHAYQVLSRWQRKANGAKGVGQLTEFLTPAM